MYHPHGMTLSSGQLKKLARGEKVRLKHSQLTGPHQVHLLKSQLNKVAKHHALKKGMDLQFSAKQAIHNMKYGSGWKDILMSGAKYLAPVVGQLIRKEVVPRATSALAGLADKGLSKLGMGAKRLHHRKPRMTRGAGFWDDVLSVGKTIGKEVALPLIKDVGIPLATTALKKRFGGRVKTRKGKGVLSDVFSSIGLGVKKPRTRKRMVKGAGFSFGDFMSGVKDVASAVAPIAVPVASSLIRAKAGMGVKKRKVHKARGLFPPGY